MDPAHKRARQLLRGAWVSEGSRRKRRAARLFRLLDGFGYEPR